MKRESLAAVSFFASGLIRVSLKEGEQVSGRRLRPVLEDAT
jgi:hypothetical protein